MSMKTISLNQLVSSPANARKTDAKADVEALAASITAHGLLQNLSVAQRAENKFEVVAGARRQRRSSSWPSRAQSHATIQCLATSSIRVTRPRHRLRRTCSASP